MIRIAMVIVGVVAVTGAWSIRLEPHHESTYQSQDDRPYGIESPVEWTTSRVRGYPEPPPPYRVERVFEQLDLGKALGVWHIPSTGFLLVAQHDREWGGPGRLLIFEDRPDVDEVRTFLERPEIIYGVAFHPEFERNGFVYIGCNGHSDALDTVATRVLRFRISIDPNVESGRPGIDLSEAQVVIEWPSNGHNGGDLGFGPDNMLYVTAGDGTSDSDTLHNGQDLSTLPGSVLRINVDHAAADQPYAVPQDNPFVGLEDARPEIWAYGLRNPWRMTFDRDTGHLWVGNNGQDLWESVHLIEKGDNCGWSINEGSYPFQPLREPGPTPIKPPTIEHHHAEARSLTGGVVHRGSTTPELIGAYVYGDYSTGTIWGARHDGSQLTWHERLARSSLQITGFGRDSADELLIVDHGGGLYRLRANDEVATDHFPRRLSDTGLFRSVADQEPAEGVIPYSVNSELWSDGARKLRFVAIPHGEKVEFHPRNSFEFPDRTVIVKTFSLPLRSQPDHAWSPIETRLLVKESGEWFGYSYAWNEAGDDAILVDDEGATRTFQVEFEDAELHEFGDEWTWRYPSRSECMVCHTRAANFVLGLRVPQLNRSHDYGDVVDNQLRTLAHIGFFRQAELPASPDELERFVDPYDRAAPLDQRARSYLHANCAHCHMEAGGGNSSIDLNYHIGSDQTKLIDMPPLHDRFELDDARLVAAGDDSASVLTHRMRIRGRGQMPPLATNYADQHGIRLVRDWIESLSEE